MKNKKFIYIKILLLSTLFTFYLYEGYYINKYYGISKLYELENHDKTKDNFVYIVPPSNNLKTTSKKENAIFSLSGIPNAFTIHCNENGYYSTYNSDRFGFNNEDFFWDKQERNFYLIGDSFVHGACVNRQNNFASNLYKLGNKEKIFFNLGYSGNGPLINFAILKEFFKIKRPEKVLWFHTEVNDLIDLKNEIKNPILKKYILDKNFNQNYTVKFNKIIDSLKKQEEKIKLFNQKKDTILKFIKLYHLRKNIFSIKFSDKNLDYSFNDDYKKIILTTNQFLKNNNSELYLIYLPSWFRYNNNIYKVQADIQKKNMANFANKNKIKFIDIDEKFLNKEKDKNIFFPFGLNGHYNELGYSAISETIYENIFKNE